MARVLKKKVAELVETIVEKVSPKSNVVKKLDPKPKAESKTTTPPNTLAKAYPHRIPTKDKKSEYIRLDDLTYQELGERVKAGSNYPFRVLMREEREDKKVTEMIVCYVGRWANCIDINSTDDKWRESLLRFNPDEFNAREVGGVSFAVYQMIPLAPEEDEPEPEEVAEKPKRVIKKK